MSGAAPAVAPWMICPLCRGDGLVDQLGVVDPDHFDEDEWEAYRDGAYRCRCANCAGTGKVRQDQPTNVVRTGSYGQQVQYEDAVDASEHLLRIAEGWA